MLITGSEQYSLQQMRDLIQVLPVAAVLLAPDATILAVNQHYASFFAKSIDEVIHRNLKHIDLSCYQSYCNDVRILAQGKKLTPFEHIFAGREHRLSFQAYYTAQQKLGAVLICAVDVSDLAAKQRQLKQHNQDLKQQLDRDELTGLASRHAFAQKLQQQNALAVAIFDLDNFKKLNDQYGHVFADRVLSQLGKLLYQLSQGYAWPAIYRIGGEEFVMLFEQHNLMQACQIIEQVRQEILSLNQDFALPQHCISLSAGLAAVTHRFTVIQALEHADQAMYMAKQHKKNSVYYYQDPKFYRYIAT
jgi:diguanylate cyclase (GGDEF)-like protein